MERRNFSIITALSLVGLFIPAYSCDSYKSKTIELLTNSNSLLNIMNSDELKELGIQYLNKFPDEVKEELLLQLIYDKHPDNISAFELESIIKTKISIDFKTSNIVELNGWVLSKTEARQCALLYKIDL